MRLLVIAALLLMLSLQAHAFALSIEDVASFWADPGEKSAHVPLLYQRKEYELILVNGRPAALLQNVEDQYVMVDSMDVMEDILGHYVSAGFPAVLLATEEGGTFSASLRTEELRRYPSAHRRELVFARETEARQFKERSDILLTQYNRLRPVTFDALDADMDALDALVAQMQQSRSLEAAEKFAARYDGKRSDVADQISMLENCSASYAAAAGAYANASRAVALAKVRFGTDSAYSRELERALMTTEYELVRLESDIGTGRRVAPADFMPALTASREILKRALYPPRDPIWDYLFWTGVLLIVGALGYAGYLRFKPKPPAQVVSLGQNILKRIHLFEEKQEKEQQKEG